MFDTPLPVALQPSLLILLAPFSVGFSSYVTTLGQVDAFADALYMLTLFLLCVLIGRVQNLPRTCPFRLSWWSVGFPLASSAGSALRYAAHHPGPISQGSPCCCWLWFRCYCCGWWLTPCMASRVGACARWPAEVYPR
ncbi:hypothetical protein O0544_01560 [Edwardsiella anguillarum]|nr:hypothetical protein [Edwardsiella anguillarum]